MAEAKVKAVLNLWGRSYVKSLVAVARCTAEDDLQAFLTRVECTLDVVSNSLDSLDVAFKTTYADQIAELKTQGAELIKSIVHKLAYVGICAKTATREAIEQLAVQEAINRLAALSAAAELAALPQLQTDAKQLHASDDTNRQAQAKLSTKQPPPVVSMPGSDVPTPSCSPHVTTLVPQGACPTSPTHQCNPYGSVAYYCSQQNSVQHTSQQHPSCQHPSTPTSAQDGHQQPPATHQYPSNTTTSYDGYQQPTQHDGYSSYCQPTSSGHQQQYPSHQWSSDGSYMGGPPATHPSNQNPPQHPGDGPDGSYPSTNSSHSSNQADGLQGLSTTSDGSHGSYPSTHNNPSATHPHNPSDFSSQADGCYGSSTNSHGSYPFSQHSPDKPATRIRYSTFIEGFIQAGHAGRPPEDPPVSVNNW